MLSNIILFVLFALITMSYVVANVAMTTIAIRDGSTIKDILSDQNYGLGKIRVFSMYWPTFVVLYIKFLFSMKTTMNDKEDDGQFKHYSLAEIIDLPIGEKVVLTPENYLQFLHFAYIANKNQDVEINVKNECVQSKHFDCAAFYGVKIGVLNKYTRNDKQYYLVTCYNAIRN